MLLIIGAVLVLRPNATMPAPAVTKGTYVALGDSVAAGVGLMGDSDSSACDRTNQSYPNQVAKQQKYKLVSLACSGATLPAGVLGSQTVNQLALDAQITQLYAQPNPKIITLTIGANDAHWTDVIKACYVGSCAHIDSIDNDLASVTTNLSSALDQLKQHYGQTLPQVVVTGYHQVFPVSPTADCSDLTGIDGTELAYGRELQSSLNKTIQSVVSNYEFARYAAVDFSGHELCTSDSWVQGLADKMPYHPTALGEQAFATAVLQAGR